MPRRLSLALVSSITALLLIAPAAFAGSSEAGWGCTATGSEPGVTLLSTPEEGVAYSPVVKESPGVIVSWTVRADAEQAKFAQQLGVFRPVGNGEYTKVAESAIATFGPPPQEQLTSYPVRIPVQKGDVLGLWGPDETLICAGGPAPRFGGAIAVGETRTFALDGGKSPVNAVVEEDKDGDGYGDFSQDRCPVSAAFQTDCPLPALAVGKISVKKKAILVEASNNTDASFQAVGDVRWKKKPRGPTVIVGFRSQGPKQAAGGVPVILRLPLPKAVRERLAKLPSRRGLRARIDVKATNLVPYVGTHEIKLKIPGRKPPSR